MVIPKMINQAGKNQEITVYGDGDQTRSFGYVGDVINAVCLLINNPKSIGQIVNIGAVQETTILDLAKTIKKITRSKSAIKLVLFDQVFEPGFTDMQRRVPDVGKLIELTGYFPQTGLETIIRSIVEDKLL
jgi:UDP-glucose 4-epimerase